MAVEVTPVSSRLSLLLQVGTDSETGSPVFRTRSFSNVKTSAGDQDAYDVAQAIAGLQEYPVEGISRVSESELEETN